MKTKTWRLIYPDKTESLMTFDPIKHETERILKLIDKIEIKCEKEKGWKYIDVLEELKDKIKGVKEKC